jgi:hypothetical protein
VTYASAGHCPPILFHKSGEAVLLKEGGTPLQMVRNCPFEQIIFVAACDALDCPRYIHRMVGSGFAAQCPTGRQGINCS